MAYGYEVKLTTGIILAILAAAGYGVGRVFAGFGLQHVKPLPGTVVSLMFGLLLALAVSLVFQFEALTSITLSEVGWLALIGFLSFAVGRGLNFLGIKYIGASRATSVYASHPLFTTMLAIPLLGERVSTLLIAGMALILGGLSLLLSEREPGKGMRDGANRMRGYGLALASAVSYGCNAVLIKWVVSDMVHPLVTVTVATAFGIVVLSAMAGKDLGAVFKGNLRGTTMMALAGLTMTLSGMSFYTALSVAPAVVVAPLGSTSPLFTLLGSYLFMRKLERVTYFVVIGCLLVVIGGVLVTTG